MAESIRLSDVLTDVSNLYRNLKEKLDKKSATDLRKRLIELQRILNEDIIATLGIASDNDVDKNWKKEASLAGKLERIKSVDEKVAVGESVELSDFFTNVSQAVVEAQMKLNDSSETYVKQLAVEHPSIPPTYFAIPSIKAEMKLGFSAMTGSGVNVVFFKSEDQKNQYVESTITFEIVSAPPQGTLPPTTTSPPGSPVHLASPKSMVSAFIAGTGTEDFMEAGELSIGDETVERVLERAEADAEVESILDARESLRQAREALQTATDQLLEARARLPEGQQLLLDEKDSVLDSITRELESRGHKLGKPYEHGRAAAVVFRSQRADAAKYLVLWPSKTEGSAEETWRELSVFHVSGQLDQLQIDGSIFEQPPPEGFLQIGSKTQLLKQSKDELADQIINLGDALMNVLLMVNDWLDNPGD